MAKIENHKYTIDEAFRECFYVVPGYQREYVWNEFRDRRPAFHVDVRRFRPLDSVEEESVPGEGHRGRQNSLPYGR